MAADAAFLVLLILHVGAIVAWMGGAALFVSVIIPSLSKMSPTHYRNLDPRDSGRTGPLRICDDPDNKLLCPCRTRTHVHQCRRCTRLSCPHHRTRSPSPNRPKIHIADKASPKTFSTTISSRSDGSATCESPEENGNSWTIGSGLARDCANPNGHRRPITLNKRAA